MNAGRYTAKLQKRGAIALGCLALALGAAVCFGGSGADWDHRCIPDDTVMTAAPASGEEGGRRVFLTFDDGPSITTRQVLDILKEEGVPATFFVVAAENNQKYLPLLERMAAEGHQVALHSCTHDYSVIYQSPENFWRDIKELKEILSRYVDPATLTWLRFPGGSTNTVSHKYGGSGIMKTLKNQAAQAGYRYVDWNVCAEDAAGGRPDAEEILNNIREDTGEKQTCVVLMHDTKNTAATAEALPEIIRWFKEKGYEFCTVAQLENGVDTV